MEMVAETIKTEGIYIGAVRGHERWAYRFDEPAGYRTDMKGNRISPLLG